MKRRAAFSLFVLTFVASFLTPAFAENGSQKGPISLTLEGADLRTVLQQFATMTASRLELDPSLKDPVTITVEDISWMTALDAICEGTGCRWSLSSGHPRVLTVGPGTKPLATTGFEAPISISAENEPIADLIERVASTAGFRLSIIGEPKGVVSLVMVGASAQTILSAICESGQSCDFRVGEDGVQVAATDSPPTTLKQLEDKLGKAISLQLKEANGLEVFLVLKSLTGCDIVIDPGINGTVTTELDDISAAAALDEICRQVGCTWTIEVVQDIGAMVRISSAE